MPREYTDEERELAEQIKGHWRQHCRRLYKGLLAGGQETLDGMALNMARDTIKQAEGLMAPEWAALPVTAGVGRVGARSPIFPRACSVQANRFSRLRCSPLAASDVYVLSVRHGRALEHA